MTLIVVHAHKDIGCSSLGWQEGGIRRDGSLHIKVAFTRHLNGRDDYLLFLLPKEPMLTLMWVKAEYADSGFATADTSHRLCAQLNRVKDALGGQ